jgi:hypothetical protein
LITPLNTATPIMRRALSRNAIVTASSEASVANNPDIAREGAAFARP